MTLPSGATVSYLYAPYAVPELRLSKYVASITTDPIGGGLQTTSYSYQFNTSDYTVLNATVTRADGSKHTVDFNPTSSSYPNLRQRETWTDTDGTTVLRQKDTIWASGAMGVQLSAVTVSQPGTDWQVRTERTVDQWGREVTRKVYDRKVFHGPYSNTYSWILNSAVYRRFADVNTVTYTGGPLEVDDVDVYGTEERVVATTRYRYDEYPLLDRGAVVGQASGYGPSNQNRGNLTSVSRELFSEGRFLETHVHYDTVGNVIESEDELGRVSSLDYSATFHYAYPTLAINPLGHMTSTNYNFNSGLPVSSTDPNGQTVSFQYETLNRISREDYPDGGWKTYSYTDVFNGGAGGKFRSYVGIRTSVDASLFSQVFQYRDGLGRLLRTSDVEPDGTLVNLDREYASCSCMGKMARVSLPYRGGQTPAWTETRFDGLGRVKLVIPPDGTATSNRTEYKYAVTEVNSLLYRVEAVFDTAGVGRARVLDAAGAVRQVREAVDYNTLNSSTTTAYDHRPDVAYTVASHSRYNASTGAYDPYAVRLSNWTWTEILQGAQTRSFKADSVGRTVVETHPENGSTAYAYADNDVLLSRTDARGIETDITHDPLDRVIAISYSDATPPAMYDYDQGAYGIGRIHSASNANSIDVYTYDKMGRVTSQQKTIGGLLFTQSSTFNLAGLPETTTLANGTTIDWSYDRMGRLTAVSSDWVDSTHPATLASSFLYDATGAPLAADWGNGTRTQWTFNENKQLKTLQHGTSTNPEQFLNLEYDYGEGVANAGHHVDHRPQRHDQDRELHLRRLQPAEVGGNRRIALGSFVELRPLWEPAVSERHQRVAPDQQPVDLRGDQPDQRLDL